jgi:hypothetical protein
MPPQEVARKTNAISETLENLKAAVMLYVFG